MRITMRKLRILYGIFKRTGAMKSLGLFLVFFFIAAVIIWLIEPTIKTFADSLWFCFIISTTIGLGDMTVTTPLARFIAVILSLYAIIVVAVLSAVITNFYLEMMRLKRDDSIAAFIDDLERLPELSQEELKALSDKVKHFKEK